MKDDYSKPKCDCGAELHIYYSYAVECKAKITNGGAESKKLFHKHGGDYVDLKRLECPDCGNYFDYKEDSNGRIRRI